MSLSTISSTTSSIAPSSINILAPGFTSLYNPLYDTDTLSLSPIISSFTNTNFCPSSSGIFSFFPVTNIPVLISGPCMSNIIAIGKSNSFLNLITSSVFSDCSSQLPCE